MTSQHLNNDLYPEWGAVLYLASTQKSRDDDLSRDWFKTSAVILLHTRCHSENIFSNIYKIFYNIYIFTFLFIKHNNLMKEN